VIQQMRAVLDGAGRGPDDIGIAVGAVTVVDRDGKAARALARREAALYLPIIAQLDHSLAIDPAWLDRISAAAAAFDFDLAASYVSDELLRHLVLAGTPDEVADQVFDLFAAGAGRVEFGTPHGLSEAEGLRLLGEAVRPALGRRGELE
jgi:5,10-methylenetetrahydromethanopterin reductase